MAALTLYGNALRLYTSALALYAGAEVTAPIQGGWGVMDTRADERRQRRVEADKREQDRRRRKAVEQAFQALDVRPNAPVPLAPEVKADIRAVVVPRLDLSGLGAGLERIDALIDAIWAEQQAEAARIAAEAKRREEEALLVLLMVA